jgi:hypothetical protein
MRKAENDTRDTGNIKSKVNETCCCETCHNCVKMRKRMERINGTDIGIKYGTDGDKMRPFNDATS